jgi:curli biogenesis system outer membrane secretion channel CsgG
MKPIPSSAAALPAVVLSACLLAGPARAEDSTSQVEKCQRKLGVLRVAEPQQGWDWLGHYGLGSPAALLRMMVQQSGCFDVVERNAGLQDLEQERALAQSGDLRQESNVGKGQMQAADFVMTPNVQMTANTGGVAGALGGALLSHVGLGTLGGVASGLKFKEASTSLLLSDVRSSIQVAAAEGKATKTDFSLSGWGWSGGAVASAGGYTSTPEGKMVAASFLDNWNRIVVTIRDNPQLIKTSSHAGDVNAAASAKDAAPVAAGTVLVPKIGNVKVYGGPSRDTKVVGTLARSDELVASGEAQNGFLRIDSTNLSGWVQQTLVAPTGH